LKSLGDPTLITTKIDDIYHYHVNLWFEFFGHKLVQLISFSVLPLHDIFELRNSQLRRALALGRENERRRYVVR
jgi:hypothetical protein